MLKEALCQNVHQLRRIVFGALVAAVAFAAPSQAIVTLGGTCESYLIQGENAQLLRGAFGSAIGTPTGIEINNVGFRRTDRLLYGLELTATGNSGVVIIDGAGTAFHVGYPDGLPTDVRFDAGDVSPDGDTLYVNQAGISPLYKVDLTTFQTTWVGITGAGGFVHDWAAHRNGLLYGGDSSHGQLAVLNPVTGVRTDYAVDTGLEGGLPRGVAYGGAWFNPNGTLSLHRNDGTVIVIDLGPNPMLPTPVKTNDFLGSASSRNDAAACQTLDVLVIGPGAVPCDIDPLECERACSDLINIMICDPFDGRCWCLVWASQF